jgi:hypothetical protein
VSDVVVRRLDCAVMVAELLVDKHAGDMPSEVLDAVERLIAVARPLVGDSM